MDPRPQCLLRALEGTLDARRQPSVLPRHERANTNTTTVPDVLKAAEEPIANVVDTVGKLSQAAANKPYYKFNSMWNSQMQGSVCRTLMPYVEGRR
jgi:hypothetical protein